MQAECQVALRRAQALAAFCNAETLCLVASGSSLPNSEGLPAEFLLTDRLTAGRCWVNVLVHHRDWTRLPVCLATVCSALISAPRLLKGGGWQRRFGGAPIRCVLAASKFVASCFPRHSENILPREQHLCRSSQLTFRGGRSAAGE